LKDNLPWRSVRGISVEGILIPECKSLLFGLIYERYLLVSGIHEQGVFGFVGLLSSYANLFWEIKLVNKTTVGGYVLLHKNVSDVLAR